MIFFYQKSNIENCTGKNTNHHHTTNDHQKRKAKCKIHAQKYENYFQERKNFCFC